MFIDHLAERLPPLLEASRLNCLYCPGGMAPESTEKSGKPAKIAETA